MSQTVLSQAFPGLVTAMGDGTTARSRAANRWRRWQAPLTILGILVLGAGVTVLPQPPQSGDPYSIDNPDPFGAMAAANVLQEHGVTIREVEDVQDALDMAEAGDTLAVMGSQWLMSEDANKLAETKADLVLVDMDWMISDIIPDLVSASSTQTATTRDAQCDDADAKAAGQVTSVASVGVPISMEASVCFPDDEAWLSDDFVAGAYVVIEEPERRISILADGTAVLNGTIADEGNAALALRALGRNPELIWLVPALTSPADEVTTWDLMPPWVNVVFLQLLVVAAVATFWRGRRLGPIVAERLPVVVPAAEASRGRGRLYRSARSYGRAASALRAGTALRLGRRLGLPRSVEGHVLAAAISRATGRPEEQIAQLLYGPPPITDAGLVQLAHELARLESEAHHL